MCRSVYDLTSEPDGSALTQLLAWGAGVGAHLGLIVHSSHVNLSLEATEFLERSQPYLIDIKEVREWPGNQILGRRLAVLRLYRLTPEMVDIFASTANLLYSWVNPRLPEDPHLLREDGSTILGTITGEADAWMELNNAEFHSLERAVPWISKALCKREI